MNRPLAVRGFAAIAASAVMLTSLPRQSLTQTPDRPTVFVHGILSDGPSWSWAADQLAGQFAISASYPTQAQNRPWLEQVEQLNSALSNWTNGISIGHSNGGLVSRVWDREHSSRAQYLATVGTAHRGATLAERAISGLLFEFPIRIGFDIYDAIAYNAQVELACTGVWGIPVSSHSLSALFFMYLVADASRDLLAQQLGMMVGDAASAYAPVLYDMIPTSPYFVGDGSLNSTSNLTREATATDARVGIVGRYGTPGNILINTVFVGFDRERIRNVRWTVYRVATSLFEYYANYIPYEDPCYSARTSIAWYWAAVAFDMSIMDVWWLLMIGALGDQVAPGVWDWQESDGVVPESSQRFPGQTNMRPAVGVTHMEEKSSPEVLAQLSLTLSDDFGILLRSAIPVSMSVSPTSATIGVGATQTFSATPRNSSGQVIARPVTWASSDPAVATINSNGVATGVGIGTSTISATLDGIANSAMLQVTSAPFSSVAIVGPTTIRANEECLWAASPTGGSDHTFSWSRNGVPVGTGSAYTGSASAAFVLKVVATSAGVSRSDSMSIAVAGSAPPCLQ